MKKIFGIIINLALVISFFVISVCGIMLILHEAGAISSIPELIGRISSEVHTCIFVSLEELFKLSGDALLSITYYGTTILSVLMFVLSFVLLVKIAKGKKRNGLSLCCMIFNIIFTLLIGIAMVAFVIHGSELGGIIKEVPIAFIMCLIFILGVVSNIFGLVSKKKA